MGPPAAHPVTRAHVPRAGRRVGAAVLGHCRCVRRRLRGGLPLLVQLAHRRLWHAAVLAAARRDHGDGADDCAGGAGGACRGHQHTRGGRLGHGGGDCRPQLGLWVGRGRRRLHDWQRAHGGDRGVCGGLGRHSVVHHVQCDEPGHPAGARNQAAQGGEAPLKRNGRGGRPPRPGGGAGAAGARVDAGGQRYHHRTGVRHGGGLGPGAGGAARGPPPQDGQAGPLCDPPRCWPAPGAHEHPAGRGQRAV
mmetsp:Transcript_26213/g.68854  ORF Transcript_26213/g.68854 Transcript_26213/m.68854 type:complete len:249 (+) Transcript_26213:630-1376(+)